MHDFLFDAQLQTNSTTTLDNHGNCSPLIYNTIVTSDAEAKKPPRISTGGLFSGMSCSPGWPRMAQGLHIDGRWERFSSRHVFILFHLSRLLLLGWDGLGHHPQYRSISSKHKILKCRTLGISWNHQTAIPKTRGATDLVSSRIDCAGNYG